MFFAPQNLKTWLRACGEGQRGQRFVLMHHTYKPQSGDVPICVSRCGKFDTGAEAFKKDPCCSWQDNSRGVGADVEAENMKYRSVLKIRGLVALGIPSVIHTERRTYVVVIR